MMSEDSLYIFFGYLTYEVTFLILMVFVKNKKRIGTINLTIQIIYSIGFLIEYNTDGQGGGALAIWFLWIITIGLHWIINFSHIIYLLYLQFNQPNIKQRGSDICIDPEVKTKKV
jgi:hypothetical protein